jgi:hypothetical protein
VEKTEEARVSRIKPATIAVEVRERDEELRERAVLGAKELEEAAGKFGAVNRNG